MIWRISVRDLKLIVDLLRDILLQIWLEFGDDGTIRFCSVDPEKVASIDMELKPSPQEYKCNEKIVFCFYLQSLFKILRGASKNEAAVLTCFKENPNDMVVRITGNDDQVFVIRNINDPQPQYKVLPYIPITTFEVKGEAFYAMIRDLGAVGKLLNVSIDESGNVVFVTKDALGTTAEYAMKPWGQPSVEVESQEFIIKYVEKFAKPGLAENIWIAIGKNSPIRFAWNMDFGYLALNVAPLPGRPTP